MNLQIPKTWETSKLGDLAVLALGGDWGEPPTFDSPEYQTALCIRGSEFRNWNVEKGSSAVFRKIKKSSLIGRTLQEGDILVEISGGGPEQPVGRTVVMDRTALMLTPGVPKICTNFVRLLRTAVNVDSQYINHYLVFFYKSGEIQGYQAGSNNLRNLKFKDYLNIELPIPPLAEQHRIVSKIEELFSELDKGVENLLLSHQQIKAYRQSLLKHAFEGGLTAEWRGRNLEVLEDIDLMFKRIELERQKSNQQKIADWESRGKIGSKPKLSKSLPPMSSDELANLPKLSKGWGWVRYGNLCSFIRNGISSKPEGATGTPIFRISAVRPLIFDMTDIRHIDNKDGIFDSYYLERGDLVFTRYNGSRHYVGVCAEYRSDEKRLFPDKLVQTRVFSKEISTSYLERALNSGCSRAFVETKIRTTAGQSGISGDDIRNIPVPICSYEEQILINSELESRLSKVDELIKVIDSALHQSASLRQSILKKAFSGQLVPQDPNDEPASKLLERIKAEVANSKPIRKKKAA